MQEDKEPLFDAIDALTLSIAAMTGMVADLEPDVAAMQKAAAAGYSTATDVADWLVRVLGLPFRAAHETTGKIVALAEGKGVGLDRLSLADLRAIEPKITADVFSVLSVEASVNSRTSEGGTAPGRVRAAAEAWLAKL
jgi:argininosuccinate lyase